MILKISNVEINSLEYDQTAFDHIYMNDGAELTASSHPSSMTLIFFLGGGGVVSFSVVWGVFIFLLLLLLLLLFI